MDKFIFAITLSVLLAVPLFGEGHNPFKNDSDLADAEIEDAQNLIAASTSKSVCKVSSQITPSRHLSNLFVTVDGPSGNLFSGTIAGTGGNVWTARRFIPPGKDLYLRTQDYEQGSSPKQVLIQTTVMIHFNSKGEITKARVKKERESGLFPFFSWSTVSDKRCP